MSSPSTLMFVLRWHGLQFFAGLALLLLGVVGWINFTFDPPGLQWQSLADMLGIWPYGFGCMVGAGVAGHAWFKGSRLRNGQG